MQLDVSHPIFNSFFEIKDLKFLYSYNQNQSEFGYATYWGIFEDNDPTRRIMVLANHNSDLAEYWEWSGDGVFGMDHTNEAYRLGVNYIVYATLH